MGKVNGEKHISCNELYNTKLIDKLNKTIDSINSLFYTINRFSFRMGWGMKDENIRAN